MGASTCDRLGILFGALGSLTIAITAMAVIGILHHHNSSLLLDQLILDTQKDFNVTVVESMLVNTTAELQTEIGERNLNCSMTNADYVMTTQTLDNLSIDTLNKTLNDTIYGCMNRTQTLEQLVAIVGMELTPNVPVIIQSGTATATLLGAGSLSTTYTVNRLSFSDLTIVYVLFPPWVTGISTFVSASSTLRFHGFSPALTNVGACGGARPLLVNRFTGIQFTGYEIDCTLDEIRIYGQGVTNPGGTLTLLQPLNLFGQFL